MRLGICCGLSLLTLAGAASAAPAPRPAAARPTVALDVTVIDPAGKPVEGALVMARATERLYRPDGEVDPLRVRSAVTGRDRRARIDAPPAAPWTVVAHARGFVTVVRPRGNRPGPSRSARERQAITGVVRDGESRRAGRRRARQRPRGRRAAARRVGGGSAAQRRL
ncbi:MAG: carboxypeptidase-like regulatory domain-containing protein [Vicinamibacteria bacterium]